MLFLLGILIGACQSVYPNISLFGPLWHQDRILLLGTDILLYVGIKHILTDQAEIERVIWTIVMVGGLLAIIGLLDRFYNFGWSSAFTPPRLMSLLMNPMFAGAYFAMLVPLGIGAAFATGNRVWPRCYWAAVG